MGPLAAHNSAMPDHSRRHFRPAAEMRPGFLLGNIMKTGTVKWFNAKKGFGFITPDDGSGDVFVHHSAIDMPGYKTLEDGQPVEFELMASVKGLAATKVRPV